MRSERKIIERILRMYPLIYGLADEIEQEQDALISDMALPATVVVEKLIELDNRRIDLCNLKVLRGFIERGLGERYELLNACAFATRPSGARRSFRICSSCSKKSPGEKSFCPSSTERQASYPARAIKMRSLTSGRRANIR